VLCLTAADSGGLEDTDCVEIFPRTAPYTFDTAPSGLTLFYDGGAFTTPFTVPMIVNARRTIAAPLAQNGLEFLRWSDGGAASHEVVGQPAAQTITATYGRRVWLPLVIKNG